MKHTQLIDELLQELSYRVGIVNIYNKEQQSIMSEILTEWGEFEAKQKIFKLLNEESVDPETPVDYEDKDGNKQQTTYKNAMSSDKESPQYKAAQKLRQDVGNADNKETETGKSLKSSSYKKVVDKEEETRKKLDGEKEGETTKPSPNEEQIKLSKEDASKVLKQILMTTAEAKKEQEGVGLGTPESRTGESVTVYAGQKIQQLMKEGKSYEESRQILEEELMGIAKDSKNVLTPAWVKSGLAVFDHLNSVYGFENIKHFAWDTPQGNALVGSTGHGTSADMFVQLKDGTTVGVSLKKDFKVFIVNGGYGKAMKEFEEKTGVSLPDNCQAKHYTQRRDSEFDKSVEIVNGDREFFESEAKKVLEDDEEFNKTFGPKKDAIRSRKAYIVAKKLGITIKAAKKMSDAEIDEVIGNTTPRELVSFLGDINNADDMKFAASFYKRKEIESKHGIYGKMRRLDDEMTENIFEAFQSNDTMREKTKEKIIEDTHIIDTLFPEEPLGDFKTVFGTDPAVEMTREAIQKIFGIGELYSEYQNAESDEEKAQIRERIEKQIKDKLTITKKRDVPVIAIVVTNEDGTTSELPLYTIGVRTRGIGNAQTLEVSQAVFGSLALKNGNTDVNSWDDKDRKTVVDGEVGDILSKFEDDKNPDLSELSLAEQEEVKERIKLLESYNSNSKKLKDLKSKFGIE